MTGTLSPTVPTIGDPNSTEDADVRSAIITLRDGLNAVLTSGNALDGATLGSTTVPTGALAAGAALANLGAASVTDAKLVSPNNSVYKTIERSAGIMWVGSAQTSYWTTTGALRGSGVAQNEGLAGWIYFDDADYTVGGVTQKLRVRFQMANNATAPGTVTYTAGLYPISSVAGGASVLTPTLGTVVAGSTVAYVNPSASTLYPTSAATGFSTDFTVPSDGHYILGFVSSAASAANSQPTGSIQLQTRNV